ncbi:hypothetical protein WS72_08140 [Burkholderia savannae]|uniref:Abasic site processing protein n=1 Tax=Burkholderia savannae TaxID=1637837 RepID=A0ABR5TCV1_9BURK|nr:SOS response-associated peptidase family protein [Burkholderia savannae]KWZ42833.1 hypothetical protein WS72_08140 [Burkholderia savannae]
MCTNYRAPSEPEGFSELKLPVLRDLWRRTPWDPEVYPDYLAPIVAMVDGRVEALLAGFGYWPRALQKASIEKAKAERRAPPIMLSTMNVRDDNLGRSPLYGPAWRAGRRCLIPAQWIYEPCYETGRNVWHRIGLSDWRPYCVAGIWRTLKGADGNELHTMAMITVNAEGDLIMSRMHKPGDEKRSVVILRPDDWEEWLSAKNIEAARAMLPLYPADEIVAAPK